jgi:medium-chain acyl-[acyl-carrier-protein] hydrolase
MNALVGALFDELRPGFDQPFAFFGHSMGAVIAYELARALQQRCNIEPRKLIVSGRHAPQLPPNSPPAHGLPHAEFMAELRRLKGTPAEILADRGLMELVVPTLRADFQLIETYLHEPTAPLGCPITAFGGIADFDVPPADLSAWRDATTGPFAVRMFPGDHFFIHSARDSVIRLLRLDLVAA